MDCEVVLRKPDDNVLPFVKVLNNERARIEELERHFFVELPLNKAKVLTFWMN